MGDLAEIAQLLRQTESARAVLVTLVRVEGTSYRKPGAKMVVTEDGVAAGAISGGCLENVLRSHALESLDRSAHVVLLDTTSDSDLLFGHGLGCPGKLQFLVEPFRVASPPASLQAHEATRDDRKTRIVVTLLPSDREELCTQTMTRGEAEESEDFVLRTMRQNGLQAVGTSFVGNGNQSYFVEIVEPPLRLLLIGSGLDVPPFIRVAESAGLEVTQVVKMWPAAYEGPGRLLVAPPEESENLPLDARTAVVVMTHNYFVDLDYLRALVPSSLVYLGVIGSRGRYEKLVADLKAEGIGAESVNRLRGPAGLDIGAETPAQIALSIVAEIQAVVAGRRYLSKETLSLVDRKTMH